MPRTRSLAWAELKIGVLTIVALSITAVAIFALTGSRGFSWQRYRLKTRFDNVAGLKSGSPVRVAGVEVGTVDDVTFAGEQVDITLEVNKAMRERITNTSTARLGSVSLLGESAVDITASTRGSPIPEWGYIPAAAAPSQLSEIADNANQGVQKIGALLDDVRTGRGTIGKLMTDEQLYADLRRFVAAASEVTEGIRQGRGSVGRLLNDPKSAHALEASLKNLEMMTARINAGEGSLGKLLKDDGFSRALAGAASNFEQLSAKMNRGEGTIGKLMTDDALFKKMNLVTDRLDQLMSRLNEGEGTAGQLMKDKRLYENMNKAVTELQALVADIRRDPRKFLNVKVSIF